MIVKEVKFGEMIVRIRLNMNTLLILPGPFKLFGKKTFGKISVHDRVNGHRKILVFMADQVIQVFFSYV